MSAQLLILSDSLVGLGRPTEQSDSSERGDPFDRSEFLGSLYLYFCWCRAKLFFSLLFMTLFAGRLLKTGTFST